LDPNLSGGPVFLRDTNVIVGVVSFGFSPNCTGNNDFSYRIDTADSLAFVGGFLAG
jgi:hypothetical protein